jgi:hypothetical protein
MVKTDWLVYINHHGLGLCTIDLLYIQKFLRDMKFCHLKIFVRINVRYKMHTSI